MVDIQKKYNIADADLRSGSDTEILSHLIEKITIPEFDWYDSLLNASMILSGMGPAVDCSITLTKEAKVFASVYALFSGITFLSTFGLLIAPVLHRFFHKIHLEENEGD